jgi:hypothetical protein
VKRHIEYIDKKLEEYTKQLAQADNDDNIQNVEKQIEKHSIRRKKYEQLSKQLTETCEAQISTSDPDSRQMIVRNNISETAYNIQTVNDDKHKLILDYKTTQNNDTHALADMVSRAVEILGHTDFIALYDKGYHTGSEIAACHDLGVETSVATPARPVSSQAPDSAFNYEAFTYNHQKDSYICPNGQELQTNGTVYASKSSRFKQYKTPYCKHCELQSRCTVSKKNGRIIQRTEHIENVERNRKMNENNPELYKKRQTIVEHPFGTIKRHRGFDHTLMKRHTERVSADVGLIFTCYNLRRIMNILFSKGEGACFFIKNRINRLILSHFNERFYFTTKLRYKNISLSNKLISLPVFVNFNIFYQF